MKIPKILLICIALAGLALFGACGGGKKTGTSYPAAGDDRFERTTASVQIELTPEGVSLGRVSLQAIETVELSGPALITRSDPKLDGNVYVIETQITEMELMGSASFGDVIVRQSPDRPSMGEVRQKKKGQDFPADSFFDVFVEVAVPSLDMTLHNEEALHLAATITALPPGEDEAYHGEDDRPLYTPAGKKVGRIIDALHIPNPAPATSEAPTEEPTAEGTQTSPTATAESAGGPESGTYGVTIEVAEGGDPAGHQQYVEQEAPMPEELEVTVADGTITIRGAAPFVEVTGTIAADGTITATGSGTVAGRPDISVAFEGMLTDGTLSGTYALGAGGELPQGEAIAYDVSGQLSP